VTGGERERAALVALLRLSGPHRSGRPEQITLAGGAQAALRAELHAATAQTRLFSDPDDHPLSDPAVSVNPTGDTDQARRAGPEDLIAVAYGEIEAWRAAGIRLITMFDADDPVNLRAVNDRPSTIFVAGRLLETDEKSIAVIGSRRASREGVRQATELSRDLVKAGYVVVSGLATGIDGAAHRATLAAGGRTLAVIGTGLEHAYPPEHARLQREIALTCAVVSQFWPESGPTRDSFPLRNGLMSGLTRGTVIVEASVRSGARIQARLALAQGRPVFLLRTLLEQSWARELAARPGVDVVDSAEEIVARVAKRDAPGSRKAPDRPSPPGRGRDANADDR
jgi:DNA processing protein